jgi:two-component sensor histidine kinase
MAEPDPFTRLFRSIQDPAFIVDASGRVDLANPAAQALIGADPTGGDVLDFVRAEPEALRTYLSRCSGTTRPLPGAFTIRTAGGEAMKWQSQGMRFAPASNGHPARILLTYRHQGVEEFSVLGQKVRELNNEVRYRRRVQAELEEVLAEKDTLLHELQHRLKNHTQMLIAMLRGAGRNTKNKKIKAFTDLPPARLQAIGAAQSFMYGMTRWELVSADRLLTTLCAAVAASWPSEAELTVAADDVDLDNNEAVPLALIINELATNALKHGLGFGAGRVEVALRRAEGELVLTVRDSGAGWEGGADPASASGLLLVKGLCRQIGASFAIATEPSTCCTVSWATNGSGSWSGDRREAPA